MPTDLERLQSIKSSLLAQIDDMTANPKPNYSIDGQSVSWQGLLDSLWAKVEKIDAQLNANEPYEIVSRGTTIE